MKPIVRALYSAGSFSGHDGTTWHFNVPNAAHGKKCAEHRADVEAALSAAVGSPITIVIGEGAVDDPDHPAPTPAAGSPRPASSPNASGSPTASNPSQRLDESAADDEPRSIPTS